MCERFGGTEDPPMDETGLTVRRTTAAPGRVSRIRCVSTVAGREEKTDWFYHQWTLGPMTRGAR
ncbi:MAG: hypothetical protein M3237_14405 [Actinomycetota bacterium]|nr:hypothetical protein [Actinomycetota bacterium]